MIAITPPAVVTYAPASQPIAFVGVFFQRDEATGRASLMLTCYDANKRRIAVDPRGMPSAVVSQEQIAAFLAVPCVAGETLDQDHSRRALPVALANLGLVGTVA